MGQQLVAFDIHSLTKQQAEALIAYHARYIDRLISFPPSLQMTEENNIQVMKDRDNDVRVNIRQMNSIAAIHYKLTE